MQHANMKRDEQLFAAKYLHVLPTEEQLARELEARHVLDIPTEGDSA